MAKGHQVQQPSVLSLSSSRQLGYKFSHFGSCYPPSKFGQLCSFLSKCHHFVPGNSSRAGLTHTRPNTARLLLRSFPKPALTLVPGIVFSPLAAWRVCHRKWPIFKSAAQACQWHCRDASMRQRYESGEIFTKTNRVFRILGSFTRTSWTTPLRRAKPGFLTL